MTRSSSNPRLSCYAWITAAATLVLICFGGLVTSHGAGLAVPDWPNTYGYNLFLFPISQWVGGIFYEHTHRLVASGVGLLTIVLALWLAFVEERRWLRWLGWLAVIMVVVQGVLGGLRVTLLSDALGVFHATLAQVFLVFVSAIALFTTTWWRRGGSRPEAPARLGRLIIAGASLILVQLILGATMRHQHAGLAIPDFPLAHGRLWPKTDAKSVALYNQRRVEVTAQQPITAAQIHLQMAHRLCAAAILAVVIAAAFAARRCLSPSHALARLSLAWLALILAQVGLGAATIWSDKAAEIATAHVAVGAASFVLAVLLVLILFAQPDERAAFRAPTSEQAPEAS